MDKFSVIFIGQSVSWIVVIAMHLVVLAFVKKRAMAKLGEELTKSAL